MLFRSVHFSKMTEIQLIRINGSFNSKTNKGSQHEPRHTFSKTIIKNPVFSLSPIIAKREVIIKQSKLPNIPVNDSKKTIT